MEIECCKNKSPPLRERKEDIPLLVNHFLNKFSKENNKPIPQLEPEVMELLLSYDWPGNIRELANVMERAVVLSPSGLISIKHLPRRIQEKNWMGCKKMKVALTFLNLKNH